MFSNCNFMLAFLRNRNDSQSVIDCFNHLYDLLGKQLFSDLFPADVRYTGISIVYQFPGFLVAGIVPGLCTYFMKIADGDPKYVCMYTILAAASSAIAAFIVQKKHNAAVRRHGDDVEHI